MNLIYSISKKILFTLSTIFGLLPQKCDWFDVLRVVYVYYFSCRVNNTIIAISRSMRILNKKYILKNSFMKVLKDISSNAAFKRYDKIVGVYAKHNEFKHIWNDMYLWFNFFCSFCSFIEVFFFSFFQVNSKL